MFHEKYGARIRAGALRLEKLEDDHWMIIPNTERIVLGKAGSDVEALWIVITLKEYAYIKQGWRFTGGAPGKYYKRRKEFDRRCEEIFQRY